MKRFLVKCLVFMLPALLLAQPLDYLISENLRKSKTFASSEFPIWNDIYAGKIDADIAVYGSSRAWQHINSQMLEDSLHRATYNLGMSGSNFWTQYLRHKEFLKYNSKPSYIILGTDLFMLEKKTELFNYLQYLPYMQFNDDIREYTSMFQGFSSLDFFIPLLRYAKAEQAVTVAKDQAINSIRPGYARESSTIRVKGYGPKDVKWNTDFDEAKEKMGSYEVKLDTLLVKQFEAFLVEVKKLNIKMIFVYTPEYIEVQKFVKNRSKIIEVYANYAKQYDIPFLDYSNDELCNHKEYFRNAEHLNKTGAELFSAKLINDLRRVDPAIDALK